MAIAGALLPIANVGDWLRPGYMSGFGNGFETEALPGAADRPQLAAEMRLRPLCRAALRLALHRAAATNERSWLYPHPPDVKHTARFSPRTSGFRTAPARETAESADRPAALDPMPIPSED
jgi:homogentisate 1,2-dioxygenase